MDDIADKISNLLSSADGVDKIKNMAEMLLGSATTENSDNSTPKCNNDSGGFSLPDFDMSKIISLASVLGNQTCDKRSELLLALKPHLCEERRERVDKAIKILKIIAIIPILKEQGLLDLL